MQKVNSMTKEELALEIIRRLKKEYPDAGCTLDYNEAWKLLVSVRLAAQCTDARTAPREDIIKAFEIMTEYFYNSGVLYTTSDNHEGFLAYWRKSTKIKLKPALHMVGRMLREMSFRSVRIVAGSSEELYAKVYKKEKDYVAVSMVVVLREYQGKGYMKKILEHPFSEAAREGIPCVLDTDTELKVAKYTKCGMKNTAKKQLKSGQYLYTMEYRED